MGVRGVATQLLARSGRAALVPILLAMVGGFWLLSPVGAAPADVTDVSVDPSSDTNAVNTVYAMTARVAPVEAGVLVRFRVFSGPNAGDTGSGSTDANGEAVLSYTGDGGVGTDTVLVWVDVDLDANTDPDEPLAVVTATWTSGVVTSIDLAPSADANPVLTEHTVTATIAPVESGVVVRFSVESGPNAGDGGVDLTDGSGEADFTYLGDGGVGVDSIIVWADTNTNGELDAGEVSDTAVKLWLAAVELSIALTPENDTNPVDSEHTVTATLTPLQDDVWIRFEITSGPNAGDSGESLTIDGTADFTYAGDGGVGGDVILAWADLDHDEELDANEPPAVASKLWVDGDVDGISLAPTSDTNPPGTEHTVTATVSPVQSGVLVWFKVASGPNSDESGSATTDGSGIASFSYIGDGGEGTDLILAWADLDEEGDVDSGEPQATALKLWTTTEIDGLTLSPLSDENPVGTKHSLSATVTPKVAGVLVRVEVLAGPNIGDADSDRTNSSGVAHLNYLGTGGVGTDLIVAWVDLDNDGVIDVGEEQATASKTWTPSAPDALPDGDASEVCEDLDGGSHPSLQALCDMLSTGIVSPAAREVLEGIILSRSRWAFPGSNGHCRDRDDDRGRGHSNHDDEDRCGENIDTDHHDGDQRGRGWAKPRGKHDRDRHDD